MEEAKENLELIRRYFDEFTDAQLAQFAALGPLYTEWNSKINVISRKEDGSLYEKHVLHSLSIAAAYDLAPGMEVLDLGTGGGFPGIPLAIFFPETRFTLADSIGKKIKVVQAISESLALANVRAIHTRAEDIRDRTFDLVVSRAVAPLKDLWRWSKPLLRKIKTVGEDDRSPNGLVCLKGGDLSQEISESGCRPRVLPVSELFSEAFFAEKFIVYVPR